MFHGTNPTLISPRVQDKMEGAKSSIERVLAGLLTPILPKISIETTIEALIDSHRLISGN